MNPLSQLKKATPLFLVLLVLACLALSPRAQALLPPPPPDGGYPNENTAEGTQALFNLTSGLDNTAIGFEALSNNTMGNNNTAVGAGALLANTMGSGNAAIGYQALENNTRGNGNTAVGHHALYDCTGSLNIALGGAAGAYITTGSNNIDIGNAGNYSDTGKIRIGRQGMQTGAFIAGIYNVMVMGNPVVVNSSGRLGVTMSSGAFKDEIKPMDKASEAILALKPVTFRYKQEFDPDGTPQFGLIAEEVEKVNPALVGRDEYGKVTTVRYEAVNAMLLNEFLKEHGKVEKLETTVARQQKQIEALTEGLQKVSAQLEASKPASRAVVNNQ